MSQVLVASKVEPEPAATHAHPTRLAYLDGWRGLSILAVLIGHFLGEGGVRFGQLGVEMFFVLSGRLMAQILFVERMELKEFYRRRLSRIMPALLVFLAVCLVAFHRDTYLGANLKPALVSAVMLYNYLAAAGHRVPIFDHTWSLCVEEHSYVLLAVLAVLARAWRWPVRPVLLGAAAFSMADGLVSSLVLRQDFTTAYWRTDTHIASILVSAWLLLTLGERKLPNWLALAAGIGGVACFWDGIPPWAFFTVGTTLLAIGVTALDQSWPWLQRLLSSRPLTITGLLSYSIYLWQQPFFQSSVWKMRLLPPQTLPWGLAAIGCGIVSYLVVERPARRWLNRMPLGR